jgi:asparaginyl-tRNA synthetase
MKIFSIIDIIKNEKKFLGKKIIIKGWVRFFRNLRFIILNDGSTIKNIQAILDKKKYNKHFLKKINIGASLKIIGIIVKSLGGEQNIDIKVMNIKIYGEAKSNEIQETILQPKYHSLEKLRKQAHLRFRTNFFSSIIRIRHHISIAIHNFFHKKGFFYIHTPIITTFDSESTGKMFSVTTLNFKKKKKINFLEDFFGKKTYLTVSGQLQAEVAALALSKVYTFGPIFRAENSNTSRHLSEFWMIEPEVAFLKLKGIMNLAENFIKYIINYVIKNCIDDLKNLDLRFFDKKTKKISSLIDKLLCILKCSFKRISYKEAINILKSVSKKKKFIFPIKWGLDLQSEHEKYLAEEYFKSPLILYNFPCNIKSFYMRLNSDEKTVRAMDVIFPEIGEIIGGSEREERYDVLLKKINNMGINKKLLYWYLDTRRFGSTPHSGFGLGLERLVQFITGVSNIRDVIPFPRTPKNAFF